MTEIMSRGGGVGINISSLRPRQAYVKGVNGRSSGAVSWGALYSFVTGLIEQGGSRRGALMLIMNDWHPDVFDFINSKREAGKITNANISVGVSDKLMEAIKADADWDLVFPDTSDPAYDDVWDGDLDGWIAGGHTVVPYRTVKARQVWNAIIESAWASAEPGVFFNERYNKMSNSSYFAPIICTNPCGEQGLPGWGVCNLGAINLAKFYDESAPKMSIGTRSTLPCATPPAAQYGLTEVKHRVPENVFQGSEMMQRGFLQALFTADGGFQDGGEKGGSIRLAANSVELLEGVQQLLLNFGIASRIYKNRRAAGFLDNIIDSTPYFFDENRQQQLSERRVGNLPR